MGGAKSQTHTDGTVGEGAGGGGGWWGGGAELLWCGQILWEEMADADFTQVKQGMDQ